MKKLWTDRRVFIAVVGLGILCFLGYTKGAEVVAAISTIVIAVAAANATEAIMKKDVQ